MSVNIIQSVIEDTLHFPFDHFLPYIAKKDIFDLVVPNPPPLDPSPPKKTCDNNAVTYSPGNFSDQVKENGVLLSNGLKSRILTTKGNQVLFDGDRGKSFDTWHRRADGAAVIPKLDDNLQETADYYLCSNSEMILWEGGVGCLEFNADHELVGYEKLLSKTWFNCGGGRSPWNTWLSAEEFHPLGGSVYEVNPNYRVTGGPPSWITAVVDQGGGYESVAWWHDTVNDKYYFYTTEDRGDGAIVRFEPALSATELDAIPVISNRLAAVKGAGTYSFLDYSARGTSTGSSGTYEWTTNRPVAEQSAVSNYPNTEGIDVKGDTLYFITKVRKQMHVLDLRDMTFEVTSTVSGTGDEFRGEPDQIAKILNDRRDIVYFCEDSGDADIHAVDNTTNYYTIIQDQDNGCENTGLTFSPDYKMMYFAYQCHSKIYQVWREDGCAFGVDPVLDIHYHGS